MKFSIILAIGCITGLMAVAGVRAEPLVRIQVDPDGGPLLLYWTDSGTDKIQRTNPDSSGVEDLVTGLRNPLGLALDASAGKLYWSDGGTDKIQRANLNGTEVGDLVTSGLRHPSGLALDAAAGKLYWTDYGTDRIQRSNLNGSEVEDVVTGLRSPLGLALDAAAGKLYWADYGTDKIQRSNLDGSEVEDVIATGLRVPRGLALDAAGGKLYWSDSGTDKIQRSNLDGSGVEDVVTGLHTPARLALGPIAIAAPNRAPILAGLADHRATAGDTLVVAAVGRDPDGDALRFSAATSDSAVATVGVADSLVTIFALAAGPATITVTARDLGGLEAAQSFALTVQARNRAPTLAVLEDGSATAGDTLVVAAVGRDPDGDALTYSAATSDSSIATVGAADSLLTIFPLAAGRVTITVTAQDSGGLEAAQSFALTVQAPNRAPLALAFLYWIDGGTDKIQRSNPDGSGVEYLVAGLDEPVALALDGSGGRIYWADGGTGRIQRVSLDGFFVEEVVSGLEDPGGLALDTSSGKLYWTDSGAGRIQRAVLDSTEVEDLVTDLQDPGALALDGSAGKLYWSDRAAGRIQRSNLDGSEVEEVATGLEAPDALALDATAGKVYWADGAGRIQRSNLDGTEVEEVVAGLQEPGGLALDVFTGKLYWADGGAGRVQRSNLDGSEVEEVVTGLQAPCGLALGPGLAAQTLRLAQAAVRVKVARHFRDPEGGELTYTAAAADSAIVRVSVADSLVTIAPRALGRTTVAVTAADAQGLTTTQPIAVTVQPRNRGPKARTLRSQRVRLGGSVLVDLSPVFSDPNGDRLSYSASSSNEAVATVSVEGTGVRIAAQTEGQATIMVKARDPWGLEATQAFGLTVEPKNPPPPPKTPPKPPPADTSPPPPPRPPPPPPPPGPNQVPVFNEGPSTTRSVAENTRANQNIQHPVSATDADRNRLTYRLSGNDAGSLAINASNGQLRTKAGETYDYETKVSYSVTLEADDRNGGIAAIAVTVHVADVDEPPEAPARPGVQPASFTSLTVTWTEPVNTGPGIDDYDVQYRKSGSFLPWPHSGSGTSTTITDLEVNTRYEVQVRASNDEGTGGWSASGFGTTSTNQPPVFDETSPTRILAENTPGGQDVGIPISATDPEGRAVSYRLTGGDTDQFTIDTNNGQLRTQTGVDYNYEVQNRYSVTVEAQDDQGGRATVAVTIDITDDDNERPQRPDRPSVTASTLTSLTLRWTEPANPGPPITDYNVQYREGSSGAFTAAAHDGTGRTTTIPNLKSDTSYEIQVQAISDEGTSPWSPSGNGRTVANQAPTFTEGSSTTRRLAENTTGAHNIGNPITATDGDGGTLTYRLEGTDRGSFTIDRNSGQLQTRSGETYDYEEKPSYVVIVRVEDGQGGSNTIEVTINLIDEQEPPGDPAAPSVIPASSTSLTVTWDEPANTGPDIDDYDVQYREGDSGGFTPWTHNSAERTATITNLTPDTDYQAQVRARNDEGASDWSPSGTGSTHPNQPPVFTEGSSATRALDENTTGVQNIGDPVSATDSENTTLTYSLEGTDKDAFTIDTGSGQLRTKSDQTYDHEATPRYVLSIKATDGHGGSSTILVLINLNDVNEPPAFTSDATFETVENGTRVGAVVARDEDSADDITNYTITGGADRDLFEIDSAGALTFKDAPNFEDPADNGRNNSYSVAVTATGGTGGRALTAQQTITVTVTDVNEPPVFTSDDAFKVDENEQSVGRVTALDVDRNDGITGYEVTGGADGSRFEIAGTNQLRFKDDPDFERPADAGGNNENIVEVTATGGTGTREMTGTQTITVTVEDVDEPPGKPDPPTVSDETESSLTVTWTEPANTGPDVTNYHVQYRDSGAFTDWPDTGPSLTRTITGLSSNSTYQIRVQAENDEGKGAWSNSANGATLRTGGICGRTEQVRDEIVAQVPVSNCGDVTADHLAEITSLDLRFRDISALQAGVFSGLTALQELNLGTNDLETLPADVFSELTALQVLNLNNNDLETLPADVFSELTALQVLNLNNNDLETLPADVFSELTALQVLNLHTNDLSSLPAGVFSGLTALQQLNLNFNDLGSLPAGVFSGLTALQQLNLWDNDLSSLPTGLFSGLSSLEFLDLSGNEISSLTVGVFSQLTALTRLILSGNEIKTLSSGVFSQLTAIEELHLTSNYFETLPADLFSGLTELRTLHLSFTYLETLPADLFSGLTELTHLDLSNNKLETLPSGVFSGLAALTILYLNDNAVSPLPITVSLEPAGTDQFKATAHAGAPFEMVLPLRVANASIASGEQTIAIAAGTLESEPLAVSRPPGAGAAVTADIKRLPPLPLDHLGYELVKSADLPLEVIPVQPVTIYPTSLSVPEDGSNTYSIVLNVQPTADVTVGVTAPSGSNISANPLQLTFTASNYNEPQAVTVTAGMDDDTVDDMVTVSHTVSGSGDYQGVTADDVQVTVLEMPDNANAPPVFTSESTFEVDENETMVGAVIATDADVRDYVTGYAITGGDDQAHFSITRGGTLTFDGNEGADHDRPVDTGEDNSYSLTVEATSGTGDRVRTATQTITVEVVNVVEPSGRPPAPLLTTRLEEERYIVEVRPGGTPTNTGPDIGGYEIQFRARESSPLFENSILLIVSDEGDWETDIPGLINGTTYEVRIQALNGEGLSEWSPVSEITIPNEAPVVDGAIDAVTGTVGGAVEIAYALSVFSDPDGPDLYLQYTGASSDEDIATVEMIGFAVRITPVAAGTATITVTARDPHGGTAAATFDATIQATTLLAPILSISGDDFTIGFTDDFSASETRAYEVRIRHKTPVGPWATGCFTATNEGQDISISETLSEPDFFEPGTTYQADYGYIGADCNGSVTSRSGTVEATTTGTPSFDIDLVFVGAISSKHRSAAEAAATRWERIITHSIPYHPVTEEERDYVEEFYPTATIPDKVDDLLIFVEIGDNPGLGVGTLADAWTIIIRDPSFLPCIARLRLNGDNLPSLSDELLADVMEHEMGHTLGFASWLWRGHNLLNDPSLNNPVFPAPDTHFSGPLAIAAFNAGGGAAYTGAKVPVENNGIPGKADSHWRENVLDDELMTSGFNRLLPHNPLSAITIQAMADIGYRVDVTQAESYKGPFVTPLAASAPVVRAAEEDSVPLTCIVEGPTAMPDKPATIILEVKRTAPEGD